MFQSRFVAQARCLSVAFFTLSLSLHGQSAIASDDTKSSVRIATHGDGKFAESPQGRIYYETEGAGSVVVLIAGGPGASHASFHPWFSRLAKQNTVVYFDNLGRGRSDALASGLTHGVYRDADDIEALRKALKAPKLSVLGHSYGGLVAAAYVAKYPDSTRCAVLSNSPHSSQGWQEALETQKAMAQQQAPEVWEKILALRAKGVRSTDPRYVEAWDASELDSYWYNPTNESRMVPSKDPRDKFNQATYNAFLGLDPEWHVGGVLADFDPHAALLKSKARTLVISGRYDRVTTPKTALEMTRMFEPGVATQRMFEKSGHRPWVEETDDYFKVVNEFLSSCTR